MKIKHFFLCLIGMILTACPEKNVYGEIAPGFEIVRFDKILYDYLYSDDRHEFPEAHKPFLNEFGEKVIRIGGIDSAGFYERLRNYFSEPTLTGLYRDEQRILSNIEDINKELSYGMDRLMTAFPALETPGIYMHVSGLMQNIIVSEDFLSISADKYLGSDYPLYKNYFDDYRLQGMNPQRIVPDYLLGFMMANLGFEGNEKVLLDRMLYEGKLRYILSVLIPGRKEWEYVNYTEEQHKWCKKNEKRIWEHILGNKHLFTPDYGITNQYLREAPYTTPLPAESPGRAGVWLGFRIVKSYMKNHPKLGLKELMEMTDYQVFLKDSKYKP